MPSQHLVKPGECLSTIAHRYGFQDYKSIYDHPDNAELKSKRPNPNLIHPGDKLVIPDKDEAPIECATGKLHRFTTTVPAKEIHLKLEDPTGEPLAFAAFVLEIPGHAPLEGETDDAGNLKQQVPVGARNATLIVGEPKWNLGIGELNPIDHTEDDGVSGIQGRLKNLGIDPGRIDGMMGPRTRSAISTFEALHKLPITGECTGATLAKLKEVHGC